MILVLTGIITFSKEEEGKGALYCGNDLESKDSTTHFFGGAGN
jgi:hypothetical protein